MAAKSSKNKSSRIVSAVMIVLLLAVSFALDKTGIWDKALGMIKGEDNVFGYTVSDSNAMNAYFIDVGQGDCTLFVNGTHSILVDCGEAEYSETVIDTLNSLNISKLDYVVATHAHSDHMGGMADIINTFETEHIVISEPSDSSAGTRIYENFLDAAENSNAEIIQATPEYTFSAGDIHCKILAPFNVSLSNENNNSVVMLVYYGKNSILMTGDAEKSVEDQIIQKYPDLKADILKTGHHGSKSSTSENFLKLVSPKTAVISVGRDNRYSHPSDATLSLFEKYSVDYYRTDTNGTVIVTCTGDSYTVKA